MHRTIRRRFRTTLLTLAALGSTTTFAAMAKADTWTVLGYIAADNNLEPYAIENIQQMMKVGSTGNLKVAIQLDRSLRHSTDPLQGVANFKGTKRLRVDQGSVAELQDLGNPDGTQPGTIGDFIKWGIQTFPADHYAVVFWDHGGGWKGCCEDESSPGRDWTPLGDIAEGVRLGLVGAPGGRTKLDLIGFDECLMAGIEIAHSLQPHGNVMVASAETEPGKGWDYEPFLRSITQNQAIDAKGVGRAIADGYKAYNNSDGDLTLSVVDLDQVPNLVTSINTLAQTLAPGAAVRETWTPIARARQGSEVYGSSGFSDPLAAIDLGNFVDGVSSQPVYKSAADGVKSAMAAAVVYNVVGSGHARSSGLSIHLPQKGANAEYLGVGYAQTQWPSFLAQYAIGSGTDIEPPDLDVDPPPNPNPPNSSSGGLSFPTIIGPIDLSGLSNASDLNLANLLVSSDGPQGSSFLGALPAKIDNGKLKAAFDGRWPTLDDGTHTGFAPFIPVSSFKERGGGDRQMLAMVADLSDAAGYRPGVVMFNYDPSARGATVARAYTFDPLKGFGAVDITKPGTKVRPWNLSVQAFGLPVPSQGTTEFDGTKLALKTKALSKGQYKVGFLVSDLAGNVATKQTPVNVDVKDDVADAGPSSNNGNSSGGDDGGSTFSCTTGGHAGGAAGFLGTLAALFVLGNVRRRRSR